MSSRSSIDACQFPLWYPIFRKHTIKSRIIALPEEFIAYLHKDGMTMPQEVQRYMNDQMSDDSSVYTVDSDEDNDARENADVSFPVLTGEIQRVLDELGGKVFIKLNWSCPSDASWIIGNVGGVLNCNSASDIYMLLKSSDRILFDLEHMYDECLVEQCRPASDEMPIQTSSLLSSSSSSSSSSSEPTYQRRPSQFVLVLKTWVKINPASEFRLFVRNHELIGISQRDCYSYYPFLATERDHLRQILGDFYFDVVCSKFSLNTYVMDVYVTEGKKVRIVDFNVFGTPTDSLLFTWEELKWNDHTATVDNSGSECVFSFAAASASGTSSSSSSIAIESAREYDDIEFRIVETADGVMIDNRGDFRAPIDASLAPDFHKFMDICKSQAKES